MCMVGKLTFFLRLQVHQCEFGIFLSQEKYAHNLIKKFALDQAKAKRTFAATHLKVSKDDLGKKMDESLYQSIIDSLLYLTASCLDISCVVGFCARYQADPKESHLQCAKHILKYIMGIINFCLWYLFDTTSVLLKYCDAY
ncbi:hypothetical protein IC582_024593 [Cucumis melo]